MIPNRRRQRFPSTLSLFLSFSPYFLQLSLFVSPCFFSLSLSISITMSLILLYLSIPLFIKETTVTIHFFFHFSFFIIQSLSLFVSLCFLSLSLFLFPSQCLSFSSLSLSRTFTFLLHYLSLSLSLLFNCSARDFCPCSDCLFSSMPLYWGEGGRGMRTPALKFARLVSLCRWCHLFRLEAATQFLVISWSERFIIIIVVVVAVIDVAHHK